MIARSVSAQLAGDIAVVSDYRYRGVSLSSDQPAVQGSVSFDARNGAFAGLFASTLNASFIESSALALAYAGYARRVGTQSWFATARIAMFPNAGDYNFGEVQAGFAHERWSAAISYAPDYFGRRVRAGYGEVDVAWPLDLSLPLGARTMLVVHGGVLVARTTESRASATRPSRYDGKVGLALERLATRLELAWVVGDSPVTFYPVQRNARRNALVASVSQAF
jgi:uncharacterized protein (TIGR02001 family)